MTKLQTTVFASASNRTPTTDPDYVLVSGHQGGYQSLDVHAGPATQVLNRSHVNPETGPFATIQLTEGVQDLTLYFDPEDLPVVEALRKALTKVAKHLKEVSK